MMLLNGAQRVSRLSTKAQQGGNDKNKSFLQSSKPQTGMMSMMAGSSRGSKPQQGLPSPPNLMQQPRPVAMPAPAPRTTTTTNNNNRSLPMKPQSTATLAPSDTFTPTTTTSTPISTSELLLQAEASRQPLSYIEYPWSSESYSAFQRNVDTWAFFTTFRTQLYLLDQKWSYALEGGYSEERKSDRLSALSRYLLASILNLGPTFIKLGQLSSTRSDLFPAEFIQELSKLQDRVPAFPADKAIKIIEKDLGQPINSLFRTFDARPIAAASLGQVHRATLFSGEEVVVKVQRPGLKQLFDIDLNNLRILAEILDKQEEGRDLKGIYLECAKILYEEIDYILEGRNADRFRRNFKDISWVRVPTVFWQYSSTRVLTLEYLPGVKITDVEKLAAAEVPLDLIASRATEAYLLQILKHGFYHADPHPGNVSVDISDGPYRGSLLFYDYGMMGEIVPGIKTKLVAMFQAIYKKDANEVLKILTELEVIKSLGGDQLSLRRAITFFLDNLTRATDRGETIANIGEDLFSIAIDQPFRFPANFTFVLRAFSTLEGIGKKLNPNYVFGEVAQPYAQELLDLGGSNSTAFILDSARDSVSELASAATAMPLRIQRIDSLLEQIEAGDIKLRVRALEVERAGRKASIQSNAVATTILSMGFLNLGTMLALNPATETSVAPTLMFLLSTVCGVLTWTSYGRIARLDKFEQEIRAGGGAGRMGA